MQAVLLFKQYYPSRGGARQATKQAPKGTVINLAGLPTQGNSDSALVLVEFSDFECPFCARHATGVAKELEKKLVQTGKIRRAFANHPLNIHSNAKLLATAATCAKQQGKFWEMYEVLFAKKPKTPEEITPLVAGLSLDVQQFQSCTSNNAEAIKRIDSEAQEAERLGLSGTPAFALGRADAKGNLQVETFINGAVSLEVFEKAINDSLTRQARS